MKNRLSFGEQWSVMAVDPDEVVHLCLNLALKGSISPHNGSLLSHNKPWLILAFTQGRLGNVWLILGHEFFFSVVGNLLLLKHKSKIKYNDIHNNHKELLLQY